MLQTDGNLLCGDSTKYEQAWKKEDFGYKEYHENNEITRAHTSGEKKRAARFRNKSAKKKTKSEKMKCINLSSDEEDEGEFEVDDKVQIVSEQIRRGVGGALAISLFSSYSS